MVYSLVLAITPKNQQTINHSYQRKLGSNTSELRMTFTWWNWPWWRVVHHITIHNKGIRSYDTGWWRREVVTKGSGDEVKWWWRDDDGKWWRWEVVRKASGDEGKWWGREVVMKGSGDDGKWWRRECGERREVVRKGSGEEGKWWWREVVTMGSGDEESVVNEGKWWGREVVRKGSGDDGKWWRRECGERREVVRTGSGDEGKWWRWEVVMKGSGDEGNAAKCIVMAAWMLHALCCWEEAGARNLAFFRVKWLQLRFSVCAAGAARVVWFLLYVFCNEWLFLCA